MESLLGYPGMRRFISFEAKGSKNDWTASHNSDSSFQTNSIQKREDTIKCAIMFLSNLCGIPLQMESF